MSPWFRSIAWIGVALLDAVIVVIGIDSYYLHPLEEPYPFIWAFDLLGLTPPPPAVGFMTFFAIGLTPIAALLLLFHSLARLVQLLRQAQERPPWTHPTFRLTTGVFCLFVGAGFLTTLGVYVLRAPQVLNWNREVLASLVHLFIAGRGYRFVTQTYSQCSTARLRLAVAFSALWLVAVAIPQHPWLVVWGDTLRDWLAG